MDSRLSWWQIYYVILEKFESQYDVLIEATDVARWLGVPEKHRLMRYYLNKLMRMGLIVRIKWKKKNFNYYGPKELVPFLRDVEMFEWEGGTRFVIRR